MPARRDHPPTGSGERDAAAARLSDIHRAYRPLPRRRRVLIVLLAVATALTVVSLIADPPGGVPRAPRPAGSPDMPRCAPGQDADCVGSRMGVLLPTPASAAAPAPVAASAAR